MTAERVIQALEVVRTKFRSLLQPGNDVALYEAEYETRKTFRAYEDNQGRRMAGPEARLWGYSIPHGRPLAFKPCQVEGHWLQADIVTEARWDKPGDAPCVQNLALRIWCLDRDVIFRKNLDAEEVIQRLGQHTPEKRVMLRYHFDLASRNQPAPKWHVQAGGNARPEECCWLHEAIAVPRLAAAPMNLVLACEMVAANLHRKTARRVLEDPSWTGILLEAQAELLQPYYSKCIDVLTRDGMSLLRSMWGGQWC